MPAHLPLSFESFIAPVVPEEFFERYWERDFLHLSHDGTGLYEPFFSLRDIERWIATSKAEDPDAILMVPPEGTEAGLRRYRAGSLPLEQLYDGIAKGHSLVLNRLEGSWAPLSPLIKMLGEVFCAGIGANVYLTPKGSKALPVHVDRHDVFVLQIHGLKSWQLYEIEDLPVMRLDYQQDLEIPASWSKPQSPRLRKEIDLRPGDLLYVPRGMPHAAVARDAPSLHLTLSVNPLYWIDFLKVALEQASLASPLLRRSLPPRFVQRTGAQEEMRSLFASALDELQDKASFDDIFRTVLRRRVRAQGFSLDGHIASLLRLEEVRGESELEKRPHLLCWIEPAEQGTEVTIRFGSSFVKGPRHLRKAFEHIRDHRQFKVAELPGLDEASQLVLARRLIREGLLRFADEAALAGS